MWRRLVAISSFALATGLGLTSLTEPSASLAASAASNDPPSGLAGQRVLVEQLQVATRVRREQQTDAVQAVAAALDAERARKAATDAADATRVAAAVRAARAAPRPAPSSGPVDWKAIVARHPWDVGVAERIVWCESRGNPSAQNGSGATGLFQILGGSFDPVANVARVRDVPHRGWQPWSTSRSCWA